MTDIILLCGSPRVSGSTSMKMLDLLKSKLDAGFKATVIEAGKSILHNNQQQDYIQMEKSDAIVIAFPLYVYCLPGALTEFLAGYSEYINSTGKSVKQKIYAVINCGFPESSINDDAAHVIKCFCKEIHAAYRFSVLIGSGAMLQPLRMLPPINKMWKSIGSAFDKIICDISGEAGSADIHVNSGMPKKLFYFIGQLNFTVTAKKNGITKDQLFKKPYLTAATQKSGS